MNEDSNLERLRELQEKLDTAETELARRDALLAAIVKNAKDAIIARDLDGKVIAWNDAATELYGWTSAEMIGESIYRIIPNDLQSQHEEWIKAAENGRGVGPLYTERISKDGRRFSIWITVSPIVARNGEVLGASAIEHEGIENGG
jgi:PAS domain S-box-containing protein